jgi:hypothetical protein
VDTGLSDPCHYYSGDEILRSTQSIQTNWIAGLAYHDPPLAAVGRLVGWMRGRRRASKVQHAGADQLTGIYSCAPDAFVLPTNVEPPIAIQR